MYHNLLLNTEIEILVLLLVACVAGVALKKLNLPYTVGLVVVGLILSGLARNIPALEIINTFKLSEELILFIFVPPLIFESALNLDSRLLLRNLSPVLVLAAPGLLISTAIVGLVLAWLTPLSLGQALLFGSLISATDPVAVIALFKELGVPKQLAILVEGESLFNDATAIVTFNIILGVIAAGAVGSNAIQQGTLAFLASFVGGILVGAIFGYLMRSTMNLAKNNSLILATITTIIAYGAFLLAEEIFKVSPVMSVVSAGLVIGWYKSNCLEKETREYIGEFWEYTAFLANSLIFLLVGITASSFQFFTQVSKTQYLLSTLGITILTVLIARAIVIFTLIPLVNFFFSKSKIPVSYQLVSYWGGLRGAVCLALALSIDVEFPNRDLIIILTLGIALFTLLIPGTTIGKLIQILQLNRPSVLEQIGQALARVIAKKQALKELKQIEINNYFLPNLVEDFTQKYEQELIQVQQSLIDLQKNLKLSEVETLQVVWSEALSIEKQVYSELNDRGFISQSVFAELILMMNLKTDAIQAGSIPPQLPIVQPLELRLGNLLVKILNNSSWGKHIESELIAKNYEYLTFLAHGCRQVPLRLRSLVANSGISGTVIEKCACYYEKNQQDILRQIEAIVQESTDITKSFQTKILNKFTIENQNKTVNKLAQERVISKSVASKILQKMDIF
jgi:CPA1 family monovalent cation:H+ antiporter